MFSNMTLREHCRHFGYLTADQAESLLDREEALSELGGCEAHTSEARAQYPAEDFLCVPIERLEALAKRLRGDNQKELRAIIESLSDIANNVTNSADYGRSELDQMMKAIKQALR